MHGVVGLALPTGEAEVVGHRGKMGYILRPYFKQTKQKATVFSSSGVKPTALFTHSLFLAPPLSPAPHLFNGRNSYPVMTSTDGMLA